MKFATAVQNSPIARYGYVTSVTIDTIIQAIPAKAKMILAAIAIFFSVFFIFLSLLLIFCF
jgi:hypothetical protein